jgi:GntR family transcriptional regulator
MPTHLVISQADNRPMYLQILEQVQQRVAVGDWPPGAPLPSIRELAQELRVSVITVKRAYQELEHQGVIVTQQGRGSFVSERETVGTDIYRRELERHLGEAVRLAEGLAYDTAPLRSLLAAVRRVRAKETA